MKTSPPIIPPDSCLYPRYALERSKFKIAVFVVVAIHLVLLSGLLIQGCRQHGHHSESASVQPTNWLTNDLPVLTNASVQPGTNLLLPSLPFVASQTNWPVLPVPPEMIPSTAEYLVVKGDTFAKIAQAHGLPLAAIVEANPGVDPRKLSVGQRLQVPVASSNAPVAFPNLTSAAAGNDRMYVVRPGDTLAKIAKAHGTSIKALRIANRLTTDQLAVGKKLRLVEPKDVPAPNVKTSTLQP